MVTTQRYHARVTLLLDLMIDSTTPQDACDRARALICERPGIRAEHVDAINVRPLALDERVHQENVRLWQEGEAVRLGTADQRARWDVGVLPDSELVALARGPLFAAFAAIPTRKRMGPMAIAHPRGADHMPTCMYVDSDLPEFSPGKEMRIAEPNTGQIPVNWSTTPSPELTVVEWHALAAVNAAVETTNKHPWLVVAPGGATLTTRLHKGECQRCKRQAAEAAALVTIVWAGRTLSREYAL